MQEAKREAAVVSFDLNFQGKLWKISGGEERARGILRQIVTPVDVLAGHEKDLQKGLSIHGPETSPPSNGFARSG